MYIYANIFWTCGDSTCPPGDIGEDMDDRTHSHADESMNFYTRMRRNGFGSDVDENT